MKIIDWQAKGNLVRFFLGKNDCVDYKGEDWDDVPCEYAGEVYDEYKEGHIDLVFPFKWEVWEANDNFSKNELKEKKSYIITAVCSDDDIIKIYMGDDVSKIIGLMEKFRYEEGLKLI